MLSAVVKAGDSKARWQASAVVVGLRVLRLHARLRCRLQLQCAKAFGAPLGNSTWMRDRGRRVQAHSSQWMCV